jgi:hypothetical protein
MTKFVLSLAVGLTLSLGSSAEGELSVQGPNFWGSNLSASANFNSRGGKVVTTKSGNASSNENAYSIEKDDQGLGISVYKFEAPDGKSSDKVTYRFKGLRQYESIVSEREVNGNEYITSTIFNAENKIAHQTTCKGITCYMVAPDVCNYLKTALNVKNASALHDKQLECDKIAGHFEAALKESNKSGSLKNGFDAHKKLLGWSFSKRNLNLGEPNKMGTLNTLKYMEGCYQIEQFNAGRPVETAERRAKAQNR